MTAFRLFRLKNTMIFANFISNVIGVSVVLFLAHRIDPMGYPEIADLAHRTNMIFVPSAFLLPIIITLIYEKPIRRYLNLKYREEPVSQELTTRVHQRLLNEPFFLIGVDLFIWFVAALLYPHDRIPRPEACGQNYEQLL